MSPKKRQIKHELEKLQEAFLHVRLYYPNSELFVGAQLQRLEALAQIIGIPWEPNHWLDLEGERK